MPEVFAQLVLEHPALRYLTARRVGPRYSNVNALLPGTFVTPVPVAILNELLTGWHDKATAVYLVQSIGPWEHQGRHRAT